jgi:3D (Asp-Asp-Asp) domain-containing protein
MRKIFLISFLLLLVPYTERPLLKFKESLIEEKEEDYVSVNVTTYSIKAAQTDETPLITASGFVLDSINPKKDRVIAVSRDLKKKIKFGQRVRVTGIGKYDGIYVVRDLMHHRWRKKIDILINPDDKPISFRKAKLFINVKATRKQRN